MPLFFRIKGAHTNVHLFAYYLEYLVFNLPPERLLPALAWFIKNGIVEQKFVDFIKGECKSSGLELIRHLTMRLERDKHLRPIYRDDLQ